MLYIQAGVKVFRISAGNSSSWSVVLLFAAAQHDGSAGH
jgi:hypothetical protein